MLYCSLFLLFGKKRLFEFLCVDALCILYKYIQKSVLYFLQILDICSFSFHVTKLEYLIVGNGTFLKIKKCSILT
jgi:hypothetical protein